MEQSSSSTFQSYSVAIRSCKAFALDYVIINERNAMQRKYVFSVINDFDEIYLERRHYL